MGISEKVAYLKGLMEGMNLNVRIPTRASCSSRSPMFLMRSLSKSKT